MASIPFQRPVLPTHDEVERYFALAREARWFSNDGPCVQLLRTRLEERVGGGLHCVPVSSGTHALLLALRAALGDAPARREVIVPSYTYIASVSAIAWAGLEPVFADVAADHWHLDPGALEEALRARRGHVGAVLACSTFGCPPPAAVRAAWEASCAAAGVPLIVDSAAGFGACDEAGAPLGGQGDAEAFSFHATKPFAIGEGGAVFARDPQLAERMRRQATFGLDGARQLVDSPGLNAKMSELHAATALAVLDGFDAVLAARGRLAERYRAALASAEVAFQAGGRHSTWQFVPVLAADAAMREEVLRAAREAEIQLRTYHEPLHLMPPLRRHRTIGPLDVTCDLAQRSLSLPLANDMSDEEVERVCALVASPDRLAVR